MKPTFTITLKEIKEILNTEIGLLSKNPKLCGKCDYYDTVCHAGLKCRKCGGEPVSIAKWTVFNAINRAKVHFRNNRDRGQEATWMLVYVAHFLEKKYEADFGKTYGWAFDNYAEIKRLYIEAVGDLK